MSTQTRTTVLELAGVLLLIAFAVVVWWPAALLVAGLSCLAASWSLSGSTPRVSRPVRR